MNVAGLSERALATVRAVFRLSLELERVLMNVARKAPAKLRFDRLPVRIMCDDHMVHSTRSATAGQGNLRLSSWTPPGPSRRAGPASRRARAGFGGSSTASGPRGRRARPIARLGAGGPPGRPLPLWTLLSP